MVDQLFRADMQKLKLWKDSQNRKPLLIRGARQTGKTWLVRTFGQACFRNVARIDFMRDTDACELFAGTLSTDVLLRNISIYTHTTIDPEHTLIFFDEIQECPAALTSLKYFCEDARQYHVIATGSYMGVSRHAGTSFPVGKLDFLRLYPLTFPEYLVNAGEEQLASIISAGEFDTLPLAFSQRLADYFTQYMIVGGMPEAVITYLNTGSAEKVREIQHDILDSYDLDFSKYANPLLVERIRLAWNSIPAQLAKENRRFVYSVARHGARARDFEDALAWLGHYGVVVKVPCVSTLRVPLSSYETTSFKLFAGDVGLLGALAHLDPVIIQQESPLYTEFKGAMAEQAVCQSLTAQGYQLYYWANPKGQAEIDFAFEQDHTVYPVEVKASTNLRGKSLQYVHQQFHLNHAIRISMADYKKQEWLTNIPLWDSAGINPYITQHVTNTN